ncbi:GTPase-activating protein [Pyrenophora tritici-repentis]|uniref:GTPase activating protein Arf n=2 Tax=Pyrenophora tritici-repentis TaxID=45151 RepID=A0A2W1FXC7_9PLEO|nr:stromal membrane-associated protein [Pyrenophora tritici-repentis Pt-1C-BFP]KAA8613617.1 Stromal membrane-associated protein [Pyrenophora tritici-repentis]EDU49449.1 stromal membrane-associated protein [Pyrenophora tritici-repentis Pt-1C-BFP]KAF7445331.1 Stromal membrane-associated protein [Pyrenophora tritici-repentis]KAF7565594.1 GTPase-activating protein that regulates ARFs (ADP-ribosylation factors) [Pyrenophora tritici-repentis]KAG9380281.1 Stromal membrane-associated protein [Pyrenoph
MSRRPNPAADRAEQNRATLKNLVKLEGNKTCSDCKRNKHPRWASWNLGVFICIRCSGIHRGMGTHISKVKSVDLDTWTDEQLQSVLKWGNARANKYWESKLAPGHVPSEAKIENFIRTKYESKRWVMDGPIPDPSTLEADDDDVPLKKVQEKVQIERSASQRLAQGSSQPPRQAQPQPAIDLFGDDPVPQRPSTGPPVAARGPPKAETAPPKQHKAGDSLLGLDFLGGGSSAAPPRPSSTGPAAAAPSRPDLKQSILSLYASKPAAASQPQQHARGDSFGGMASPPAQTSPQQSSFGGMNDAFSSLSFNAAPAPKPSPFSGLDSFSSTKSPPATSSSNMFGGGGNFFDSKPAAPAQSQRTMSPSSGLGDFGSFSSPAPSKPAASSMSGMNDLLDLSMPSAPATSPPVNNAFNLSSPAPTPAPKAAPAPAAVNYSGVSNMDAWGGNDVWSSPAPSQPATNATASHTQASTSSWGAPAVAQDDDFGGWSSAAPTQTTTTHTTTTQSKPAGGFGGASDDLFSNVWE